jgi:CelD/BcsL family acetyltransferase involved in cellulose biosynthesis
MEDRIEWITERARLEQIAAGWDRLAEGPFEPFLGSAWGLSWWSGFGGGRSLRCCALWRGERLAALFPLAARGRDRLEALANEHSPLFAPLAEDPAALRPLAEAVLDAASDLSVLGLPAVDPAVRALTTAGERHVRTVDRWLTSPLTTTSDDFASYRAERKKDWRELERRRRKLFREHRVETRLLQVPEDVDAELDEGLALEASGWKGDAGTAMASNPTTDRFYRSVARALSRRGQLRLSSMYADGALVAFDLAALHGTVTS